MNQRCQETQKNIRRQLRRNPKEYQTKIAKTPENQPFDIDECDEEQLESQEIWQESTSRS